MKLQMNQHNQDQRLRVKKNHTYPAHSDQEVRSSTKIKQVRRSSTKIKGTHIKHQDEELLNKYNVKLYSQVLRTDLVPSKGKGMTRT